MKKQKNKLTNREVGLEDLKKIEKLRQAISSPDLFHHKEDQYLRNRALNKRNLSEEETENISNELVMMHGLENGYWVSHVSYGKHVSTLSRMRKKIIDENDCKNTVELMIVDRIVASYWRIIRYETVLNRFVENEQGQFSFSQLSINALKEVNKGLEIAHRQHSNNIILLKELKQPNLKVTVKTDNAYFAENQQINNNKSNDILKNNTEIIKP
jgi:hypothetical protein